MARTTIASGGSLLLRCFILIACTKAPRTRAFLVIGPSNRVITRSSNRPATRVSTNKLRGGSGSSSCNTMSSRSVNNEAIDYDTEDRPYAEASYDPGAAESFYETRKLTSLVRLVQFVTKSSGFLSSTLLDRQLNRQDDASIVNKRSEELLDLVTELGPTFIKVGQALSTRTDLLPQKYAKGLTKLQDAVPPFPGDVGRAIIERELGIRIPDVFSELSTEPVASASVGQVYRGTLRGSGEEVAVKVQRPRVLQNVALDLYMIRSLAPLYKKNQDINTDLVGLVDAWGEGFVNELDYTAEANATTAFSRAMRERGLNSVFAPEVVEELSSTHVLTTKWVDGERLSDSDASDVPRLCGVALNAYLTMLLDTGTLHCDPHPGNLLRTPDGKLCILDWGMVINVPQNLQLSLLEFIADLNAENYEDVPKDLVNLGFVPEDKLEELRQSGLTVAISTMLKLAAEGGGPKGAMQRMVQQNKEKYADALAEFDDLDSKEATAVRQKLFREDWKKAMAEDALSRTDGSGSGDPSTTTTTPSSTSTTADVTMKIEQMQQENADVFAIPDYFVYMSRAFSTLEGIGLSSDPNYSILQECYPYLAKRLLSDDSPRARGALRTLLYGGRDGTELNLEKFKELADGVESYTASTSSVESSRGETDEGRNAALALLADVVLAEESNYVQELLLRETAVAVDATVRDALLSPLKPILGNSNGNNNGNSFLPLPPFFPPPPPLGGPLAFPFELARASLELQSMDDRDEKRLENVRILSRLLGSNSKGSSKTTAGNKAVGEHNNPATTAITVWNNNSNNSNNNNMALVETLAREAAKRRVGLGRMALRFGSSVASVQAERLRYRAEAKKKKQQQAAPPISELAERLAVRGADNLEGIADAISSLDRNLSKRMS